MKFDFGKVSIDNVFMMLWIVVILAVMLVTLLGQFLTTVLLGVAIVAYIHKMADKAAGPKK